MKPYYQDDWATIWHGDCREILPSLPKCDLVLTDPPYDMPCGGGPKAFLGGRQYGKDIVDTRLNVAVDFSFLDGFDRWFCFCSKRSLIKLLTKAQNNNWMLLTWNKPNPIPMVNGTYLPDTEYIVHSYVPGNLFGDYRDRSRFILWPSEQNDFNHSTVKPLSVVARLVRVGSQKGEIILDPFMGSGTTLRAAKDLQRKSIGIEIEEKYCEIAARRLAQEVLAF